ncbi:MAG TPA: OB-fold nucleic acid binding domain-containing protein, partial [Vampirovibrionales bacterium]
MDEHSSDLIGQRQYRLEKVSKLRELGIDPYPSVARKTHTNQEVIDNFDELEGKEVTVIGRLDSWREHGQLIFGEIRDQSGKIQLYIKSDTVNPTNIENQSLGFEDLNLVDLGDFVLATGEVTKTQRGEISVMPHTIKVASKTIRPLPNEMEDKEERFRRRYVDMNVHPEVRQMFERRAKFWQAHRDFLNSKGFFEVNIPVLE